MVAVEVVAVTVAAALDAHASSHTTDTDTDTDAAAAATSSRRSGMAADKSRAQLLVSRSQPHRRCHSRHHYHRQHCHRQRLADRITDSHQNRHRHLSMLMHGGSQVETAAAREPVAPTPTATQTPPPPPPPVSVAVGDEVGEVLAVEVAAVTVVAAVSLLSGLDCRHA